MQPHWLRKVRLEIGAAGNLRLAVEELHIAFDLRRESQPDNPVSTIKVYNLSQESESQIAERGETARLLAGYGEGPLGLVGEGQIRHIVRERSGLDRVATIHLGASDRQRQRGAFSHSYEGRVSLALIIRALVEHMGLELDRDSLSLLPTGETGVTEDYAFKGKAEDALRELLWPLRLRHYEENGVIRLAQRGVAANTRLFVLSEASGMVGTPSVTENGASATMLLNTNILLDQPVRVESSVLQGIFKTSAIVHRGDNRQGEFVTELELKNFQGGKGSSDDE